MDCNTQLVKCQRYFQIYSAAEARPNSWIDYRPEMGKPDTGDITQGQIGWNDETQYYYNSAEL